MRQFPNRWAVSDPTYIATHMLLLVLEQFPLALDYLIEGAQP